MLRLHPPKHSVPDNFWHTLMIGAVASLFVWQTGQQVISLFTTEGTLYAHEKVLLAGEGQPFETWLLSFAPESYRLLWGRGLSCLGWAVALLQIVRSLKPQYGFVGTLPSVILLLTIPGLSAFMCGAGSGSWALVFFLKAYFTLIGHETKAPLIRGGIYAGLAVLLHPIWVLPVLGMLLGCREVFRYRLKWVSIALGGSLFVGGLMLLLTEQGGAWMMAGPGGGAVLPGGWGALINRYLLLGIGLVLMLVYGSKRRGVGWWSLVCCLPLILLEPLLASGLSGVLLPIWVFVAVGITKLPGLMDLQFPRAYQSVLLCQLLLWVPVYTGSQPLDLYAPIPSVERPAP